MVAMKKPSTSSSGSPITDLEVAPPVLTAGQKRGRKGGAKNGKGTGASRNHQSEHEMHIWTERERRKKMRNMFSNLHSLLPQLPQKADKSSIVDEAVRYIKTLEKSLQTLENQKREKFGSSTPSNEKSILTTSEPPLPPAPDSSRETFLADQVMNFSPNIPRAAFPDPFPPAACFQTWFSPNIVLNTCGNEAQISVCTPRRPGLLTTIVYILQKHNLEVLSAHVSSNQFRTMYMIHAQAVGGIGSDQVSGGHAHALSVEEAFKLAAGEMNLWLLTCT